ncbi:hypothetical protein ACT7SV_003325, partial [Vibrio cholerae]
QTAKFARFITCLAAGKTIDPALSRDRLAERMSAECSGITITRYYKDRILNKTLKGILCLL